MATTEIILIKEQSKKLAEMFVAWAGTGSSRTLVDLMYDFDVTPKEWDDFLIKLHGNG